MVDFRGPNGGSPPSTSSQASNPNPAAIEPGHWARAENAAQRIIWRAQPTLVSDERRREVIGYVQRLFRNLLGCEVFSYGSVPLKTYLPDGDIDLTAFGGASEEDYLANGMVSILEGEDQSRALEFVVKDIQLVRAEVKLVKCIVNDVVVDISFNQIGGLCTLCFLEQVDCLIGKDHLFKRSIILIKAWCYYESRILGAHHGLISTYALETLVLYIFHLFHSTLCGPLQVLYKFLDYFSKFDWENYCVSLTGPVRLPDLVVEVPENGGGDLLLSSDFLRYCTEMFSVPSRGFDSSLRTFQPKHLNIVDPLKEANNLGRSVSKGNFYRIRSAFTYGARKLGRVLLQPEDDIGLSRFFSNTLDRHGSGQRPDVEVARPLCATSGLESNEEAEEGTLQQHHETRDALDFRLIGDASDLAQLSGLRSVSPTGAPYPAPHLHISHSVRSNGEKTVDLTLSSKIPNDHTAGVPGDINGRINGHQEHHVSGHSSPLSDLSGHHEHQLSSLKHGRWLYDHVSHMQGLPRHPGPLPPIFHGNNSRDAIHHPAQFRANGFPHIMGNGPFPNPALYAVNPVIVPPSAFGFEDMPKPRGTGTYFPIMGRLPQPHRPPVMKGGSHGNLRSPRHFGRHPMFMETNMVDHISPEFLHPSVSGNQSGAPRRPSRPPHSFPLEERGQPHRNGPDGGFEMNQQDRGRHWRQRAVSSAENASPVSPPTEGTENLKPVSSGDHDRASVESSYHLKDEDDFPPLPL